VVVIPPDFSRKLHAQKGASIQIFIDGSFPSRAEIVQGYLAAINAQFNIGLLSAYLQREGLITQTVLPISVEGRVWYNPSLEAKNSTIPGLLVIRACLPRWWSFVKKSGARFSISFVHLSVAGKSSLEKRSPI
jgi:ABC-2 type transport system permease protein